MYCLIYLAVITVIKDLSLFEAKRPQVKDELKERMVLGSWPPGFKKVDEKFDSAMVVAGSGDGSGDNAGPQLSLSPSWVMVTESKATFCPSFTYVMVTTPSLVLPLASPAPMVTPQVIEVTSTAAIEPSASYALAEPLDTELTRQSPSFASPSPSGHAVGDYHDNESTIVATPSITSSTSVDSHATIELQLSRSPTMKWPKESNLASPLFPVPSPTATSSEDLIVTTLIAERPQSDRGTSRAGDGGSVTDLEMSAGERTTGLVEPTKTTSARTTSTTATTTTTTVVALISSAFLLPGQVFADTTSQTTNATRSPEPVEQTSPGTTGATPETTTRPWREEVVTRERPTESDPGPPTSTAASAAAATTVTARSSRPDADFFVQTAIHQVNQSGLGNMAKLSDLIASRLERLYQRAAERSFSIAAAGSDGETSRDGQKGAKSSFEVKMQRINYENSTNIVNLNYTLAAAGIPLTSQEANDLLSRLSKEELRQELEQDLVFLSAEDFRTLSKKSERFESSGRLDWISLSLLSLSVLLVFAGLICGLVLWRKNQSLKRRLVSTLNSQSMAIDDARGDEVGSYHRWRRVSESKSHSSSSPRTATSNSEFEYVSFARPTPRPRTKSKAIQSSGLELVKEKVVPIPFVRVVGDVQDGHSSPTPRFTLVPTRHEDCPEDGDLIAVDSVLQVRLSEQTETIVRAIQTELRKFNHNELNVLPMTYRLDTDGSVISTSSDV